MQWLSRYITGDNFNSWQNPNASCNVPSRGLVYPTPWDSLPLDTLLLDTLLPWEEHGTRDTPPHRLPQNHKSRWYTYYWNAFLCKMSPTEETCICRNRRKICLIVPYANQKSYCRYCFHYVIVSPIWIMWSIQDLCNSLRFSTVIHSTSCSSWLLSRGLSCNLKKEITKDNMQTFFFKKNQFKQHLLIFIHFGGSLESP